jgi:DNA repair protein RadA/Sms
MSWRARVILIGGEPGIGKSTLLLEVMRNTQAGLYVTGEESLCAGAVRGLRTAGFDG